MYRPQTNKLTTFLLVFELLVQFLRHFEHDTIILGDFNIDTINDSADKTNTKITFWPTTSGGKTVSQHELHQHHQHV